MTLRKPDGSYPTGLPNDPTFFPVGVWLAAVLGPEDTALDSAAGLNTYVALAYDELANLDAVESSGMHLLLQVDEWMGHPKASHPAVDGWLVSDEADMMFRPGWDDWNGTWEVGQLRPTPGRWRPMRLYGPGPHERPSPSGRLAVLELWNGRCILGYR